MSSHPIRKRTWLESFEALKKYKAQHGDCLVPIHNYHEDLALGGWVNHQRSKKHKLSQEQKQKLDAIGFTWSVRMRNKQWNSMMEKLKAYKEEHGGDCNVPVVYEADTELADFCQEQRKKFARGQLSGARQKQLQEMGLALELQDEEVDDEANVDSDADEEDCNNSHSNTSMQQYDDDFDKHYQKLVDFHVNHGHCDIDVATHELGAWVTQLRQNYSKHAEAGFSDDCFELLEELGFDWDGPLCAGTTTATATATDATHKKEEDSDQKTPAVVAKVVAEVIATAVEVQDKKDNLNNNAAAAAAAAAKIVAAKPKKEEAEEEDLEEDLEAESTDEEESNGNHNHNNSDSESLSSSDEDNNSGGEETDSDDDNDNKKPASNKPKGFSIMSMKRKSSIITSGMPKKPRRLSSLPINHHKKPLLLQVSRKRPALALPTNKSNNSQHSSNASVASSTGTATSSKKARRSSVNSTTSNSNSYCPSRDERFMKQYQDLVEFKKQYGHTRVPQSKKWKTLGGWVNNLRVMYKRDPVNGVRKERVQLLNDVGFVWNATADMPSYDVRWEEQYSNLLEFKKEYGHCRVPQTGPHRKLGRWVATQRALYTKDPMHGIRSDRLKRLNDIEFTWDAKGFKGKHFYTNTTGGPGENGEGENENGETTTADGATGNNGDGGNIKVEGATTATATGTAAAATVSSSSATSTDKPSMAVTTAESSSTESDDDEDGASVAAVVAGEGEGEIPASSIAVAVPVPEDSAAEVDPATTVKVEDVLVDTEYDVVWDQYYAKLVEYHKVHKNFKVPATYDANLSRWVKLQRERKQEKDPRHVKLLDDIGFDWVLPRSSSNSSNPNNKEQPSLNDVRWEQLYHQLVAYKTQHGHCRVPQNGENKRLGKWVATQRLLHNKGHESGLRPERFKLLDDLGFTWNAKEFRSRKFSNNIATPTTTTTPELGQEGGNQAEDSAVSGASQALAFPPGTAGQGNINHATVSISSGRIQPLVAKLCELMDHPNASYPNPGSKLDYIEKYKRSLEGMIVETKVRLEAYKQMEPAKKEDPPATAIKQE